MIKLEKFTKFDFQRLISWITSEEELICFAGPGFSFPLDDNQLLDYINSDSRLIFKVIDTKSNKVIGHCELNNINYKTKNARICRIMIGDKSFRNKGYCELLIKKLINLAFEDLGLNSLTLKVYENNVKAISCYKNCGFEVKGTIHKSYIRKNIYWTSLIMSLKNET